MTQQLTPDEIAALEAGARDPRALAAMKAEIERNLEHAAMMQATNMAEPSPGSAPEFVNQGDTVRFEKTGDHVRLICNTDLLNHIRAAGPGCTFHDRGEAGYWLVDSAGNPVVVIPVT
jgi:hypothetical protein